MATITLGLAGAIGHDPAAALFIDDDLVAAVEEERLLRRKHATGETPYYSARQCMQIAGVKPSQIDRIAIPYAPISLLNKARWHYAYRHWYAPDRSIDSLLNGNRRYRRYRKDLDKLLEKLQIPVSKVQIVPVEHQLAHASSCYHLIESDQKTAVFCNDSKGEYSNIFLGYGENGNITRLKEFYNPDSLCGMYAAMTDYLGFEILDGEFKVMGISPFGDASRYDLSPLAYFNGKQFKVRNKLIGTVGLRRYKAKSKGHFFSQKLLDMLGPRRVGNLTDDPYVHYAAAIQKLYEDIAVGLVAHYLSEILEDTGILAVAGTGAMNIRLNRRLLALPMVKKLIVHPACSDSGTAIGAAAYAIRETKTRLKPISSMFLGPSYTSEECIEACKAHREKPDWKILQDPHVEAAELLNRGELVAWFQGRMEFGARALGNRSILANPTEEGIADIINRQVKFREKWRPFSPSVLDSVAAEFSEEEFDDEYMCIGVTLSKNWQEKYPAIAYADGSTRAQIVRADTNPSLHKLLSHFHELSGQGLLINTALSRPGEALVCNPEDAINMFMGTDLKYLILENILVTKREESETW
ncbi:MAG TPA: carbamoyltransferase [Gammaproteobacteria bacterium]|jgi:carbamoyltransferase|nr:carbamoyltransferase [Gammaproteobacteria bacterium]HAT27485.1 carbamoyltransferase [Gammaproteobacteria bacterium]|tara:strand:- start:3147 stop:4895 length:1749 start_codon:yes stop_codon:yes gene_type:complete